MERTAHTKRNLMNTKFSMVTVACMFESFNETSSQWSIVKRKFLWLFCLSSIVVSNPSDRRPGHAFHPIIPKFKMNASSLLKSVNVTEFGLLVRNPSAVSAITMTANGQSVLGRSSVIWQHRSESTLVQVMACCPIAPNHYLNNVELSSVRFCGTHWGPISLQVLKISIHWITSFLLTHLSRVNEVRCHY